MARSTFTQEDILRSKLLPPNWYPVIVKKFSQEQAGTDGSDLFVYEIIVEGTGPFVGVPIRFQISEKALGMGVDFVESCGQEVKAGVPFEHEKNIGKHIDCYVQRGEYKGRPQNNPVGFRKRQEAK